MQGSVDSSSGAPEPNPPAEHRRRLWAQSKDSMWQSCPKPELEREQELNQDVRQDQEQDQDPGSVQQNGRVPHKISSWLSECRTPIGASLDEHSSSNRGLRAGCSFEDDLSLGAEANHLQSSPSRSEPGFGLAADRKRTQFKERARSMNSTGSGKSSTVSSVSELLDLYEEDPEEILMNLGFGREEPDLASKVPSRFFNGSSCARGIDVKVFLGAQLQRLELENPNYALTSRFRQIEVLTTVANEFFQLYSQVSGQPLHRITPRETGAEGDLKEPLPVKKSSSALNAAKLLKKSISKHNLLAQANAQANVHANALGNVPNDTSATVLANAPVSPQPSIEHSAQAEENKLGKLKMDACVLSSVSEESASEGEPDSALRSEQISSPGANQSTEVVEQITNHSKGEMEQTSNHRTGEVELTANSRTSVEQMANNRARDMEQTTNHSTQPGEQTTNHSTGDMELTANSRTDKEQTANQSTGEEEKAANEMSTSDRAVNPQLTLLRTENTDSFDIEEIHSGEDDMPPQHISRNSDLTRTVSQQSDSSGFAEEPSSDSCSFLKVQESSDSCDSETTVTSHPSQDLATPLAVDQPAFGLLTGKTAVEEESKRLKYDELDQGTDAIPQYIAHQLPKNRSEHQAQRSFSPTNEETLETPKAKSEEGLLNQKTLENTSATSEQDSNIAPGAEFSDYVMGKSLDLDSSRPRQAESPEFVSDHSESSLPPAPPSPVLCALHRAKLYQRVQGRGRARCVPLQRSSSLPTTVTSSIHIQLGRGKGASCNPPQDDIDRQRVVTPLRAIPRHLAQSVSSSPPPDWTTGVTSPSWSTQSVPELSVNPQQTAYQHPPEVTYPQAGLHPYPYINPYGSMPNLLNPHSPVMPRYPAVSNHSGFSTRPDPHSTANFPPGPPNMSMPWFGGSYASLYPSAHGAPQTLAQNAPYFSHYGTPTPSMSHYSSHTHLHHMTPPPHPGFHLGPSVSPFGAPTFSPEVALHSHVASSSEMQLRQVLREIRGTLHSLRQGHFGTPDVLMEQRAPLGFPKTLSELLLKRRSLNAFRSQMMELELNLLREQAPVYRHLSPSDRLEVEQLQRLRSAVREELQELETQLEERLLELSPETYMGFQQGSSEDNLSSASALRAMEPVSDLLREQLVLQSELSYHSNSGSPASSCCSSQSGRTQSQGAGHYRATISITPATPPRPSAESLLPRPSEELGEESHSTEDMPTGAGWGQEPQATPPVDLQQLIREIRQSVAQDIRREIYSELLVSIAPSKQQ